jgi:hypothetical protein
VSSPSVNQPHTRRTVADLLTLALGAPEASGFTRVRVACSAPVAISV